MFNFKFITENYVENIGQFIVTICTYIQRNAN